MTPQKSGAARSTHVSDLLTDPPRFSVRGTRLRLYSAYDPTVIAAKVLKWLQEAVRQCPGTVAEGGMIESDVNQHSPL